MPLVIQVYHVASLQGLGAMPVVPNGSLVWVDTLRTFFEFDEHSAAPIDGITVVAAKVRGKFVRSLLASRHWSLQSTWHLNAQTGDDQNDGATSATAVATVAELQRRWADGRALGRIRVLVESDTDEALDINFRVTGAVEPYSYVRFQGVPKVVHSGIVTGYEPYNSAAGTRGTISDATQPNIWALSAGRVIRFRRLLPELAEADLVAEAFVIREENETSAWISQPVVPNADGGAYGVGAETFGHPAVGDTYEILELPRFGSSCFVRSGTSYLELQYVAMGAPNVDHVAVFQAEGAIRSCVLSDYDTGVPGQMQLVNCYVQRNCRSQYAGQTAVYGGVLNFGCSSKPGRMDLQRTVVRNGAVRSYDSGYVMVKDWACIFDAPHLLEIHSHARAQLLGRLWGTEISSNEISVSAQGAVSYDVSILPLLVEPTVEISLGGEILTYSQFAALQNYVNPMNGAAMVADT